MSKRLIILLLLQFLLAAQAPAQLQGLLNSNLNSATEEKVKTTIQDVESQLSTWRVEAQTALARLEALDSSSDLPEGIQTSDFTSRKRILNETLLIIGRHQAALDQFQSSRTELAAAKALAADWKGLDTPPPHSILLVDEFQNLKEALEERATSKKSSIDTFKSTLESLFAENKIADEKVSIALGIYEGGGSKDPSALWVLEAAKEKKRSLVVRASALKTNINDLDNQYRVIEIQLGLLNRKIVEASLNMVFRDEDLEKIRTASASRQNDMRREISELRQRLSTAVESRKEEVLAVEKILKAPDSEPDSVKIAKLRLESADLRVDTLQMMIDSLDTYEQLEAFVPESYDYRLTLMTDENPDKRKSALDALIALHERLNAWEIVAKNELDAVTTEINRREKEASPLAADDPEFAQISEQREALRQKRDLIQRVYGSVTSQRDILKRWISTFEEKEEVPWYRPLSNLISGAWEATKRAWNIPVSSYIEVTREDGLDVTNTRYVSLGSVLRAIVLFAFAYFIAAMISRHIQRLLIRRHILGENQARTLRNWIMLVVAFLLALATLSYFSIPLTVFAFLAGALAIGVGFGTQTIIKNFISGIILLFERKIRVGDIVEVDGIHGVVSEINTRSSIVRGFNGIENLIPNSLLLENRVVNWTLNSRFLRRELELSVAYGTQPQKVITIMQEAADRHGLILKDPAPFAIFKHFGESALDFTMFYWIELNEKTNGHIVGSDLRIMIDKKFSEAGVTIPFPQRDLNFSDAKPIRVTLARSAPLAEAAPESSGNAPSLP